MGALTVRNESYQQDSMSSLEMIINKLGTVSHQLEGLKGFVPRKAHDSEGFDVQDFTDGASLTRIYLSKVERLQERKREIILRNLHFGQLKDREFAIADAHARTFQWIYAVDSASRFREWLEKSNGIYWVAGKAGSGKSTLMKFLTQYWATTSRLRDWAGDQELVVAKYFFWSAGTAVQKSQEGLYRALLLQILTQRPELMPKICADRWAAPYADSFNSWSREELVTAMANLASIQNTTFKVCLFVDGLDEYEGDHGELVKILQKMAICPYIKICAASRPWLEFADAFESGPKLYLEDLTHQDMLDFVHDELQEDARFQKLQSSNRVAATELVSEITARAQGVFLWTFLVVRSLLRGLRNEDNVADLRRRLQALPSHLSDYFTRMLVDIEDVYRQRASRLFITLAIAQTSFPVITFFFMNFDDQPIDAEPLYFLHDWPNVDTARFEILTTKKRQLIAQCKDLIYISPDPEAPVLFAEKVGFLHRTVVDFIQADDTTKKLLSLAGEDFDPKRVLFQANLGQARSLMHLHALTYIKPRLSQWILGCLFYAYQIEVATGLPETAGLDELETLIMVVFGKWGFSHAMECLPGMPAVDSFLKLVCMADLSAYVRRKIPQCSRTRLDELVPGWQECWIVQQQAEFELQKQRNTANWRLGQDLDDNLPKLSTAHEMTRVGELPEDEEAVSPKTVQFSTVDDIPVETRKRLFKKITRMFQ